MKKIMLIFIYYYMCSFIVMNVALSQNNKLRIGGNTILISAVKDDGYTINNGRTKNRNKKVRVKVKDFYINPLFSSIEKGEYLTYNILKKDTNYRNVFAEFNDFMDNLREREEVKFAIGIKMPSTLSTHSGVTYVGYEMMEGITFYRLGKNKEVTKLNDSYDYISKRVRIKDSLTLYLYVCSYKKSNFSYQGDFPERLEKVKLLAKKSVLIEEPATYSCTVYVKDNVWSLEITKE